MQFIINGDIPSTKNNKRIVYVRGRPRLIPSVKGTEFMQSVSYQLRSVMPVTHYPVKLEAVFFFSSYRRRDLDNALTTLLDALKTYQVIVDDNFSCIDHVVAMFGGVDKLNPRCEVTIHETKTSTADSACSVQ